MFKRFLPALSSSSTCNIQGETLFDIETSSGDASSKHSNCSSEQINKSDIPTLRRRHSFVTPYAESVLEEEINRNNENADLSIDPFDSSNTLKRSKSLSFNISRRPSFSTLRKKVSKSVRFDPQEEFCESCNEVSKQSEVSTLFGTSESFHKKNSFTEDPLSSQIHLEETDQFQRELGDNRTNLHRSQENNKINKRYALLSQGSIISGLEPTNTLDNQKDISKVNFLPLGTSLNCDPKYTEEYSECELDNSCLVTEYSPEETNQEDYIEDHESEKEESESLTTREGTSTKEHQMMIAILENLKKVKDNDLQNLNDQASLQEILDYSEQVLETTKLIETEITQLKSQLRKKDDEKFETMNNLQEKCTRLQTEFNNCKIEREQISKKYDQLLCINTELERNEKSLRSDILQLKADVSSSVSRLQLEINSRQELLSLIGKYDSSEELSDHADALKGYIEQLFLKNETLANENHLLLEEQLQMKNKIKLLEENQVLVAEQNKQIDSKLKELELRLNGTEANAQIKLDAQNKLLEERNVQISEFKSQANLWEEEKEYLKAKLSEYLLDIEEANKQIQEELEFRNQLMKDYNELNMKLKETESMLHKKVKTANDQLLLKQSEFSKLNDTHLKMKQENTKMLEELRRMKTGREDLTFENQSLTKDNTDYKLNLYFLQEHIKKANKTVEIMSKEYLLVLKSNEIVSNYLKTFALTIFQSLKPVMYEESTAYFENIYYGLEKQTLFSQDKITTVESIIQFITRCISDIVSQYLENETVLLSEIENRNNNYQKMLDKLTKIMEDSIEKSHNSKENMSNTGTTEKLQSKYKIDSEHLKRGILQESKSVKFIS